MGIKRRQTQFAHGFLLNVSTSSAVSCRKSLRACWLKSAHSFFAKAVGATGGMLESWWKQITRAPSRLSRLCLQIKLLRYLRHDEPRQVVLRQVILHAWRQKLCVIDFASAKFLAHSPTTYSSPLDQ